MTESEPGPGHEQTDPDAMSRAGSRSRAQSRSDKGSRSGKGSRSDRGARSARGARSGKGPRFEVESAVGLGANRSRHDIQQAYRKAHRHPWLRRGAIALAGGLAVLMTMGVMVVLKLNSNITQIDVSGLLGKRPERAASMGNQAPMNILVMGVDTRDLGTNQFGSKKDNPGARADTTLLVHLSGDRKSAVVVSIPRDSITRAPTDCKDPGSPVTEMRMWNANSAPACVMRALEGNTNIPIDHFVVVNFVGFQSMVEALGQVTVCLPEAVNDPYSGLHLPAGISRVSGANALAFVRIRKNIGKDGSDLNRIPRQQAFLSSMVQEATSTQMLLQPVRLLRFLDAATRSLAMDPGLGNLNTMREVAQSVVGMKTSQIRFVTVPNEPYPPNHNRVQWTSAADLLWKSIRLDAPLPGTKPAPAPTPGPTPTATKGPALTVRPDKITVHVVNASGASGLGKQAADDLAIQGFRISTPSTATTLTKGVIVAYSSMRAQSARTVVAAFPGARLVKDESAGSSVRVTLGAGSPFVVLVPNRVGTSALPKRAVAAPTSTVIIKARTADTNACKA